MDTLAERIRYALDACGNNQTDLAQACGVSRAAVSDWCLGETHELKARNLFAAADFLGVRPQWLALGSGSVADVPRDPQLAEIIRLFECMDSANRGQLLQAAKVYRTLSFTGDPHRRAEFQRSIGLLPDETTEE